MNTISIHLLFLSSCSSSERSSRYNTANVVDNSLSCLIKKYTTLTDLERAAAECLVEGSSKPNRVIGVEELKRALNTCIWSAQEKCFEKKIKDIESRSHVHRLSSLLTLNPFLDSKVLLRVGGLLSNHRQQNTFMVCAK